MANDPKDLTGLLEYSKKLHASGEFPVHPGGEAVALEEVQIEQIAEFETLDEYGKHSPVDHEAALAARTAQKNANAQATNVPNSAPDGAPHDAANADALTPESEFAVTEFPSEDPDSAQNFTLPETTDEAPQFAQNSPDAFVPTPQEPDAPSEFTLPAQDEPAAQLTSPPEFTPAPSEFTQEFVPDNIAPSATPAPTDTHTLNFTSTPARPEAQPPRTLAAPASQNVTVNQFSDRLTTSVPHVAAGYPFSLFIEGELSESEKERLVSLLEKHQFGIRALDLEPQLAQGSTRILIPRISEYAGVVLVQSLRDLRARMMLAPSDQINALILGRKNSLDRGTLDLSSSPDESNLLQGDTHSRSSHTEIEVTSTATQTLSEVLLTTEALLPGTHPDHLKIIDVVTASAGLDSRVVEPKSSPEYQNTLDALLRELKLKAKIKGATAVLSLKIQLDTLSLPSLYRLTVTGLAVVETTDSDRQYTEPFEPLSES